MRILALIDTKTDKDEALKMLDDYSDFIEKHFSMEVTYWVERRDFSNVPTVPDSDGDLKPTFGYMRNLAKSVHDRYGDYGVDDIIMWVHEDNFVYKGIWGTALSYVHYKYNLLLCRWDKNNPVNTFNTLFHEGMHPANTIVEKELGIDINALIRTEILLNGTKADHDYVQIGGFDWDRDIVHGGLPSVTYIGRRGYTPNKANMRYIKFIAPQLRSAYQKRLQKHFRPVVSVQRRLLALLQNKLAAILNK